jgi:hypothetical protein
MRQIFSIRFFAALGGVAVMALLVYTLFGNRDTVAQVVDTGPRVHTIDLVAAVFSVSADPGFDIGPDGRTTGTMDLVLDLERRVHIVEGTYGEITCDDYAQLGQCAVVADLLGEAVVWFALVPLGRNDTVEMPAIVTLEGGLATLENGWQVPYASVLDRRCATEYGSFREFQKDLGTNFVSIFDIEAGELTDVVCKPS